MTARSTKRREIIQLAEKRARQYALESRMSMNCVSHYRQLGVGLREHQRYENFHCIGATQIDKCLCPCHDYRFKE